MNWINRIPNRNRNQCFINSGINFLQELKAKDKNKRIKHLRFWPAFSFGAFLFPFHFKPAGAAAELAIQTWAMASAV